MMLRLQMLEKCRVFKVFKLKISKNCGYSRVMTHVALYSWCRELSPEIWLLNHSSVKCVRGLSNFYFSHIYKKFQIIKHKTSFMAIM